MTRAVYCLCATCLCVCVLCCAGWQLAGWLCTVCGMYGMPASVTFGSCKRKAVFGEEG